MKNLIFALVLAAPLAHALPVLNENGAVDGSMNTLWPDHLDTGLYYYAPTHFEADGVKLEKEKGDIRFAGLTDEYRPDLEEAMAAVKKLFPSARFKRVPVMNESITAPHLIEVVNCDADTCHLRIQKNHLDWFVSFFEDFGLYMTKSYRVEGIIRTEDRDLMGSLTFGAPVIVRLGN